MPNSHTLCADDVSVVIVPIADKIAAISGATGYIGKSLVSLASAVAVPLSSLREKSVDVLVHLAAKVGASDIGLFLQNIALDNAVASFCAEHFIPLLYASGNNVYPLSESCREDDFPSSCLFTDFYALAKMCGETLLYSSSNDKLRFVALRIGDVFGVGQKHGNLFRALEGSIKDKAPLKLYGQGIKTRSFIYSDELVRILKYFIADCDNFENASYNAAFPEAYKVSDIVNVIAEVAGLGIEHIDFQDRPDTRIMDCTALIDRGYVFSYTMRTALEQYVREITKKA